MCIHCLCHLPLLPLKPPVSRQNLFHPLVLWFCWRETIGDKKEDILFLLVWDKDSYTERFLVLLPCTCELHGSSLSDLFVIFCTPCIVVSASLRLLICSSTRSTSTTFNF
jgi:hypothetical protein